MESTQNLLNELISIKQRYERVLDRFGEFVSEILAVMKADERLAGIDLIVNDDNSLNIRYLDRELFVKFSLQIDDDGNRKELLTCYKINGIHEHEYKKIHSLTFDGQGRTDIPPAEGQDPYEINNRVDALNILFHWLRVSLNESS